MVHVRGWFWGSLASLSAAPLGALPQETKLLDRLLSVRSLGTGRAFESSPDGRWLFVSESGSLAVIDALSQPEYHLPRSIVPMGEQGVMAVDLMLDPAAQEPYGDARADLLYVAGGRSGLWAAEANTTPGLAQIDVGRIDDATTTGSEQDSRRWCDDLDHIDLTVSGLSRTFLVALFGAKDDTRLRLYEMDRARGVVRDAAEQIGHEISADLEVVIARHPLYPAPVPGADDSRSFGFAMEASRVNATEAIVYLAMGEHGLARIRLTSAMLEGTGTPTVQWGPVFGRASTHAAANPLYGDLHFVRADDHAIEQVDLPVFADVAVQQNVWGHYLYAAVDHLGWVRFDLDGAWSPSAPIDHHEGRVVTNEVGQLQTSLVIPLPTHSGKTFARRLSLVQRGNEVFLGVAAAETPMRTGSDYRNDGQVLNSDFNGVNGVNPEAVQPLAGDDSYSIVYRLQAITSLIDHTVNSSVATTVGSGGDEILLYPDPSALPASQAEFFGSDSGTAGVTPDGDVSGQPITVRRQNLTFRSLVDTDTDDELRRFERAQEDRPGTRFHVIGFLRGAPEVLVRGSNDCCVFDDGIYVVCHNEIHSHYQAVNVGLNGFGDDDRGSFGVWLNPQSNWRRTGFSEWLVFGSDDPPGSPPSQYSIKRLRLSRIPCGDDTIRFPQPLGRWFLEPSPDRWGRIGRQYWMSGMQPDYDRTHAQASDGWELLFATRGGTPDGMVAIRRELLEDFVTDPSNPPGSYTFAAIDAAHPEQVFSPWFVTHPEFQNVPLTERRFLARNRLDAQTFFPTLFRAPGPGSTTPDTWVLGVPCAQLTVPPGLPDFNEHPEWQPPAVYLDNYDHLLVRFWDAQDPARFFGVSAPAAHGEIIGPHARAAAVGLDVEEWQGRVLGFVTDHGGRILVYDITTILQPGGSPELLDVWESPKTLSDDVVNPIRIAFLDHARWSSGGQLNEALYVYAGVLRVGVQILEWNNSTQSLEPVRLIETPGDSSWVERRPGPRGAVTMLVADGWGVRLYGYSD